MALTVSNGNNDLRKGKLLHRTSFSQKRHWLGTSLLLDKSFCLIVLSAIFVENFRMNDCKKIRPIVRMCQLGTCCTLKNLTTQHLICTLKKLNYIDNFKNKKKKGYWLPEITKKLNYRG